MLFSIISLVDDIFALFNSEAGDLTFFSYINNKRKSIKLSFLDVLLDNVSPSLKTSVCIKKTFNELLTGLNSFTFFSYKSGFVICLMWSCGRADQNVPSSSPRLDIGVEVTSQCKFP